MFPINRLEPFFPPRQSIADKLLAGAWGFKIEMMRFGDDDDGEVSLEVEIKSSITDDKDAILAGLLSHFRQPRSEGGVA